jgi:hypothetical protein
MSRPRRRLLINTRKIIIFANVTYPWSVAYKGF